MGPACAPRSSPRKKPPGPDSVVRITRVLAEKSSAFAKLVGATPCPQPHFAPASPSLPAAVCLGRGRAASRGAAASSPSPNIFLMREFLLHGHGRLCGEHGCLQHPQTRGTLRRQLRPPRRSGTRPGARVTAACTGAKTLCMGAAVCCFPAAAPGSVPDRGHEEPLSPSVPRVPLLPSRHASPRRPAPLSAPNRSPPRGHFDPLLNSSFPLISDQALNLLAEMPRSND